MKQTGKKLASLLLLLSMLLVSVGTLSGCSMFDAALTIPASITSTAINEDGELIVYYSNGTSKNLGVVTEKKEDPAVYVTSAEVNESGELILHYSDNTTKNLGVIGNTDGEGAPGTSNNVEVNIDITGDAESAAAIVAAAAPSVVSVYCTFTDPITSATVASSAGSGVIYSIDKATGDALIITNYHVVYDADAANIADKIQVFVYGSPLSGQAITATFVGGSMKEDIAVLRVKGSTIMKESIAKAAVLANSDAIHPGDTAIAIGNPQGKGISATYGKVNVVTETLETTACDDVTEISLRVIRIDTAVNGGNSGGGIFDSQGRLIGIVSAKSIVENIENVGFALPINKVQSIVDNILYHCLDGDFVTPLKPTFGITVQIVDSKAVLNEQTGLIDIVETIEVIEISEGSLADGVYQVGDRLICATVGDKTTQIIRIHNVTDVGLDLRPGETIIFKVLRDGVETELEITPPSNAYNPF
ncbi:MAG: serine protease [Clostridia bacterium]|nr:serine protease [Clostridia bacterium]